MTDIRKRLRQPIIAPAIEAGVITPGPLAERLILERREAAAIIDQLVKLVEIMIGTDPNTPITNGGHTVLDYWRRDAEDALNLVTGGETNE